MLPHLIINTPLNFPLIFKILGWFAYRDIAFSTASISWDAVWWILINRESWMKHCQKKPFRHKKKSKGGEYETRIRTRSMYLLYKFTHMWLRKHTTEVFLQVAGWKIRGVLSTTKKVSSWTLSVAASDFCCINLTNFPILHTWAGFPLENFIQSGHRVILNCD